MAKILVVGTGFGQLPIIKYCKDNDIYTVGVDANPNSLGAQFVNEFKHIDVTDSDNVLKLAKETAIDAILTMQSDAGIETVGWVNDQMNLIGVSHRTARFCANKDEFRVQLQEANVRQPRFLTVHTISQARDAFAEIGKVCVVKAPDSSGSRGITKVNSINEIDRAFNEAKKYSKSGNIVVEEFISGVEVGAQTFSNKGRCVSILPHNDLVYTDGAMVPIGHSFPLRDLQAIGDTIYDEVSKALSACGIKDGPANVDLIIDDSGKPWIIEIGARIGATCLPELASAHINQDWVGLMVEQALGEDISHVNVGHQPCAARVLFSKQTGVLTGVKKDYDVSAYADAKIEVDITVKLGDKVSALKKGTDRLGKVMVTASSLSQAEKICSEISGSISFVVR